MADSPLLPNILIVEDKVLIGMVLEDILDMLGRTVIANAASMDDAHVAAGEGGFDLAILDVHVGGDPVFPLADQLVADGIPVIFATGASPDALPERFRGFPVLEKPYAFATVETMLANIDARHRG